jgi:DNA end-binding protein Ku
MSARPIGSATIAWGLVSLPVKLYSAGDSTAAITFNWIHRDCGSRLKQQYICARDGVVVERDDMVKGYEFAKDQYVLFTPEELKAIEEQSKNEVEIAEFVPAAAVDKVYLDKVWYLGPDKGGDRAYRLLSEAMKTTGLSALGRYAARGKQYLVLISPLRDGLVMEQLRYAHEIRSFDEVPTGTGEVKDAELKMAVQLIEQVASDTFDAAKYTDDVRARIQALVQKKIEGEDITAAPTEEPKTQIIDLMAALKASLARAGEETEEERRPAKRTERAPGKSGAKRATAKKKASGAD